MIHQHTHLDTTVYGPLHGRKDTLSLLITTQGKILDVDEFLGTIDLLRDALEDIMIIGE